jgi:dUTP pyrophosphatase
MRPHIRCANCGTAVVRKPSFWKRIKGLACCSKTCRAEYLKTAYAGDANPNWRSKDTLEAWWRRKHQAIAHSAEQRHKPFTLTVNDLRAQYESQNGLCFYTGIPLQLASTKNWKDQNQADLDTLSVDRVDSTKGYEVGNIVLCCNAINRMKGNASVEDLQDILGYVVAKSVSQCVFKVKILPGGKRPQKQKLGDAGYDLVAAKVVNHPHGRVEVRTGVCVQPEPGWWCELVPRSSIGLRGFRLVNSLGIIDSGYTGELVMWFDKVDFLAHIREGERIGQLIPRRHVVVTFVEVPTLDDTERGSGGFGSTGVSS